MMDHLAAKEELQQTIAEFALQVKTPPPPWCAEYHSPNASTVLTAIASLIAAGWEGGHRLSPRKCGQCGGWFVGEVGR